MIAAAKPACPHCDRALRKQAKIQNEGITYTLETFSCKTTRQSYWPIGVMYRMTRSKECLAATNSSEPVAHPKRVVTFGRFGPMQRRLVGVETPEPFKKGAYE